MSVEPCPAGSEPLGCHILGLLCQPLPAAAKVLVGPFVAPTTCALSSKGLFRSQAGSASDQGWWRGGGGRSVQPHPLTPTPSSICFS